MSPDHSHFVGGVWRRDYSAVGLSPSMTHDGRTLPTVMDFKNERGYCIFVDNTSTVCALIVFMDFGVDNSDPTFW